MSDSRARLVAISAVVAGSAFLAVALAGSASSTIHATITVRVDARDFSFGLSRRAVPAGSTVRFAVRNRGRKPHRFVVNGKRTRLLARGQGQTLTVRFPRKGAFRFVCPVANHERRGMKGSFSVTAAPAPEPPPEPEPPIDVSAATVRTPIGTFERPILVTAPSGDDRVFVVEQSGTVRIVRDGEVAPLPFLDLRGRLTDTGESGLLSIAFSPDYAESGLLYAFYNLPGGFGDIRIAEFRRDPANPDAVESVEGRELLTIPKPFENHNGGMLQFGPDGLLYVSVGDGDPGAVNPPGFYAQRRDDLLGDILRIDPRGGDPYAVPWSNPFVGVEGVRPEIWAYGLRNPWRFWIDHESGVMHIADVGSTSREEVDAVGRGESGLNFGWPCFEGTVTFDATASCESAVPPLFDFPRENGVCAVIGGVVARDTRISALEGRYLYGDLCTGRITAVGLENGRPVESAVLDVEVPGLSSFGVDGRNRIYATSILGDVFRLDPNPAGCQERRARDLSSATQAAARRPSQIGVRST